MLKKTYLSILLIGVIMVVVIGAIAQIITMKNDSKTLGLEVKTINEAAYTAGNIPLEVEFQNNGKEPIKILDVFDDPKTSKIFFNVTMTDVNGTPISTMGGGKISFSENSLKYIEIKKGGKHTVRLNLKDFLANTNSIKSGVYNVSIIYRNQYGENCFKGNLQSDPITLSLNE